MAFLKKHSDLIAYLVLTAVFIGGLWNVEQNTIQKIQENQLEACERGNIIRLIVYRNTREAASIEPKAHYKDQLRILKATPYIRANGTIDCEQAVK